MQKDIRWIQRFQNFNLAFKRLLDAYQLSESRPLSDLENQGYIQAFEFSHELAWKVLKDYLEFQGNYEIAGSRDASREAFKMGLIIEGETWMEMLKSRNLTSHTYNESVSKDITLKISQLYVPAMLQFQLKMNQLKEKI
jgi:nucleotidyltransferase substrate binding protein (TIGR01987 family)